MHIPSTKNIVPLSSNTQNLSKKKISAPHTQPHESPQGSTLMELPTMGGVLSPISLKTLAQEAREKKMTKDQICERFIQVVVEESLGQHASTAQVQKITRELQLFLQQDPVFSKNLLHHLQALV